MAEPDGLAVFAALRATCHGGADEDPYRRLVTLRELAELGDVSLHGKKVLDIGSGSGVMCLLAAVLGCREGHGVDRGDEGPAEFLRCIRELENAPSVDASLFSVRADAAHLPYPSEYFDFALMVEVCSHLINLAAALAEAARVLAHGGVLVISDAHNALNPLVARQRWRIWEQKEGLRPGGDASYLRLRRDYIRTNWPELPDEQVGRLAENTSGATYAEIRRAYEDWRETGSLRERPYCPRTPAMNPAGWYDERLLDPFEVCGMLRRSGMSSTRVVPYWGRSTPMRRFLDSALRRVPGSITFARGYRVIARK